MKTKYLLYTGSAIPIVFFATIFICGFMLGGYNHFSRMVSELGAMGARSRFVFSAGFILCSVLSLFFVMGLCRACRATGTSAIPVIMILSYSLSIAGSAVFPLPLRLHLLMGLPFILLILSPLLGLILWNGERQLVLFKQIALLSFFLMALGFLPFMPGFLRNYTGLKQRFFHVGWSVWFFYLSYSFIRLLQSGKTKDLH